MNPVSRSLVLAALLGRNAASPIHYWGFLTKAVLGHSRALVRNSSAENPCGEPLPGQKMWFAGPGRCSVASADMLYLAHDKKFKTAKKGDIIEMNCDDVMCPVPFIRDCYMEPDICGPDQWCWIKQHEKWGAWGMAPVDNADGTLSYGHTTDSEYCYGKDGFMARYQQAMNSNLRKPEIKALNASMQLLCPASAKVFGGPDGDNAWRPVRGQCVPYRQEQQSCVQEESLGASKFTGVLGPRFKVDESGATFERPLACAPSLVCTAPNFNVLPSTCVEKRPPNVCFYGPWWDSSDCPRDRPGVEGPGLSYDVTLETMRAAALLFPGEISWPGICGFWDRTTTIGKAVARVRLQVYNIAVALWPRRVLKRAPPTLEELASLLPDPIEYLVAQGKTPEQASEECPRLAEDPHSEVSKLLAKANVLSTQPNKVWSLVHFLTFNLPAAASEEQVQASRALATLLTQNFWCNDCRSFFEVGVVKQFGLPPAVASGPEIARWWWHAHNVASEHVATTRGGHPWIHQLRSLPEYQNPFYMDLKDAWGMWHVPAHAGVEL